MTIFSDPSIPELVLLDAGEAVLVDEEDLVLLDAGEPVLLDACTVFKLKHERLTELIRTKDL